MTARSTVGIAGALLLPTCLGILWWGGAEAGYINPWSMFWVVPMLIALGIPVGFVLGWFTMAFLQGFVEERGTRIEKRVEGDETNGPS
jgi:hypothetical protein